MTADGLEVRQSSASVWNSYPCACFAEACCFRNRSCAWAKEPAPAPATGCFFQTLMARRQ